ncbi:MAG: hypothetical protein AB7K24_18275 [Gemmataceae bacterium]
MKRFITVACAMVALLAQGQRVLGQDSSSAASSASSAASAASGASGESSPTTFAGLIAAGIKELKKLKAKCCNDCPSGQIIKAMTKQINMATGGLICPGCCPDNAEQNKNKPSTSAAGACAKIQQDTKEMPKRRDAVKCLAYVDCHWWPEAEAALINSLRTDKNECVRLEAALVLQRGCCCTKKVIEALKIVVEGSNKDGNPSENSERVRDAAMGALQHCLHVYQEEPSSQRPEAPPAAPEAAPAPGAKPATSSAATASLPDAPQWYRYYQTVDAKPLNDVLADARRALAVGQNIAAAQQASNSEVNFVPTGQRSLLQIWNNAQATGENDTNNAGRLAPQPQRPGYAPATTMTPRPAPPLAREHTPIASARGQSPTHMTLPAQPRPATTAPPAPPRAKISFEELQ